jgi:nucleoid-associated protein YgaU
MLPRLSIGGALVALSLALPAAAQVELANLREDVRGLTQKVGELSLRLEEMARENAELRRKTTDGARSTVTLAQLNDAIADLNHAIKNSVDSSQKETLQIVSAQLKKLGEQTNAALDAIAKSPAARPSAPTPAPVSPATVPVPEGATTYVVQKGDSLAAIAKKTGAKQQEIATANKLADPSLIVPGQTLIIPRAK